MDQDRKFSDTELRRLFDSDADLSLLSGEEQTRLLTLTEQDDEPKSDYIGSIAAKATGMRARTNEDVKREATETPLIRGAAEGGLAGGLLRSVTQPGSLRQIGGLFKRGHDRMMSGAMKAPSGYLKQMSGKLGIPTKEQRVLDVLSETGINPMSAKGGRRIQTLVDDTAAMRKQMIDAAPDVPIPGAGRAVDRAGRQVAQKIGRGDAPQARVAASQEVADQIRSSPHTSEVGMQRVSFEHSPRAIRDASGKATTGLRAVPGEEVRRARDLTPRQSADVIEETNNELRGMFGETKLNPRAQTLMGVRNARATSLDQAAGTREISTKMRDLIDTRNLSNVARRRGDANNPISLTDIISLSSGHPGMVLGSAAMKPRMSGAIASKLGGAGRLANRTGDQINPEMLAAAIRALMLGGQDQ